MDTNIHNNSLNGGGNDNVIIRIPFLNEFNNIIFKSDLNGSITPGSNLVWNKELSNLNLKTWSQNNYVEKAYLVNERAGSTDRDDDKAKTYYRPNNSTIYIYTFRPIIEYRE